jgi:hypothetical protein
VVASPDLVFAHDLAAARGAIRSGLAEMEGDPSAARAVRGRPLITIGVSIGTALPEPKERLTPVLALRNAYPNGTGIDGITDQEDHGPEDEQRFDPEGQDIEPRE